MIQTIKYARRLLFRQHQNALAADFVAQQIQNKVVTGVVFLMLRDEPDTEDAMLRLSLIDI